MKNIVIFCAIATTSLFAGHGGPSQFHVHNQVEIPIIVDPLNLLGVDPVVVRPYETATCSMRGDKATPPLVTFGATLTHGRKIFIMPAISEPVLHTATTLHDNDYVILSRVEGRFQITYARGAHAWPTCAVFVDQAGVHGKWAEYTDGTDVGISPDHALDAKSAEILPAAISSLRTAAVMALGIRSRL
jgi:hypothetical protein